MEHDIDITTTTINHNLSQPKQHLITNEKFNLLKECQQNIFLITEISPSMRKIINELITEENLQVIKSKFIAIFS